MKDCRTVSKSILALAIPAIIANITTPLLALVDTAIVGHLGNAVFIAAVALGGSLFSLLYWPFGFLRMGTSGLTAQADGAGDHSRSAAVFYRALLSGLAVGLVLIMLQQPLGDALVDFLAGPTETANVARTYFDILIYGAPASLGIYAVNGWLIGRGNVKPALWLSIAINLVNISASLVMVFALGLGVKGLAAGTLIAQWIGFGVGCLMVRKQHIARTSHKQIFDRREIKHFFSINTDIFFRTLCLVAVTVWFTRAGARQSDIILAVNSLLMQLFILFSYIMDGFAYAGEALVGKAVGARDRAHERSVIKGLFAFGAALSLVFTIVYALGGDVILRWLCDELSVIEASAEYRWWAVAVPFAGFGAFIWDGIYIGATRTRMMLIAMALSCVVFFCVWFGLSPWLGNHALWLAFILYLASRALFQTLFYLGRRF